MKIGWVALALAVVCLFSAISYSTFVKNAPPTPGDAAIYASMSQSTFIDVPNPYGLRQLSPITARQLQKIGFDVNNSWFTITATSIWLSLLFFYLVLIKAIKISPSIALASTLAMAVTYNFTFYNFLNYWLVDPVTNLLLIAALYFAVRQNIYGFIGAVVIGSINKESALLLLPMYFIINYLGDQNTRSDRRQAYLFSLIALVIYFFYRQYVIGRINPQGGGYSFFAGPHQTIGDNVRFSLTYFKDFIPVYKILGFLWLAYGFAVTALIKQRGLYRALAISSLYLFLVLVFLRIFTTDSGRVIAFGIPLAIAVIACYLELNFKLVAKNSRWLVIIGLIYAVANLNWLDQQQYHWSQFIALAGFIYIFVPQLESEMAKR